MKLPLYHRPSALAFLDDEVSYLEMLALVLPKNWLARLYSRVDDFALLANLQAEEWERDLQHHRRMVDSWHQGLGLPGLVLDYWRTQNRRYSLSSIAVIDYAMPAANGLDVIKSLPAWPIWRVLLTGQADEQIAVDAFNNGLIHRFVTKQTPDLGIRLIEALNHHYNAPLEPHESIWRNAMRDHQHNALKDQRFQQSLSQWLNTVKCAEYITLPEPFGVLALDQDGTAHWLQMELEAGFAAAAEIAAAAGCDAESLAAISQGQALCNAEFMHTLGIDQPIQVKPAKRWGAANGLSVCHFDLSHLGQIGTSYEQFIASCSVRTVDPDDAVQ